VLPLNNLDYIFELSDGPNAPFQPNVILSGSQEPANGGFFLMEPQSDALDVVSRIVQARSERGQDISGGFDPFIGWGHSIVEPDYWESNRERGQNWTFHAPFGMQGLLYYYAKYVRQNVTIVLANRAQNWETGPDGEPKMLQEIEHPYDKHSKPVYDMSNKATECHKWTRGKGCPPPYNDFKHFSGTAKPWFEGPPNDLEQDPLSTPQRLWWHVLFQLNDRLQMGIIDQLRNWKVGREHHKGWLTPNKGHARDTVISF
jgi:hypothetical protein